MIYLFLFIRNNVKIRQPFAGYLGSSVHNTFFLLFQNANVFEVRLNDEMHSFVLPSL